MTARGRIVVAFAACVSATACGTEYAQTAVLPPGTATVPPGTDGAPPPGTCGSTLASRLTVARFDLAAPVRYRRYGYNLVPEDERIAFGIDPGGAPSIAWLENDGTHVHVTSLDATLSRRGADVVIDGVDVGGLVARPDGAAVLIRRDDPGQPLADPLAGSEPAKAAVLVRIRQGVERAAMPLTGTASVVAGIVGAARDCAGSPLNSRLEWNGSKYGAYFAMHGCEGDAHAPNYGDKLVYLDDDGRALPGGWAWGCSISQAVRLLPEPGVFTPICLSDQLPFPGLNLVVENTPPVLLAQEDSARGYSGGRLGSLVRMGDGTTIVGWLSRDVRTENGVTTAAKPAPDIALLRLDDRLQPIGQRIWLTETSDVAEAGVHFAAYGPDRLLFTWDTFENIACNPQTCDGTFTGTHARLLDANGQYLTPDEIIPATPNEHEDIRVFPNGDLGFVFVDVADRNRAGPLPLGDGGVPTVPELRSLGVARLSYCR